MTKKLQEDKQEEFKIYGAIVSARSVNRSSRVTRYTVTVEINPTFLREKKLTS